MSEYAPEFQERIAGVLAAAGFPRMPARVMMLLMVSEDGLTAAEIAERLDISAAAVSGAVRYLQLIGYVARIPVSGSRRDRYTIARAWYTASMTSAVVYQQVADAAAEGVATLPAGSMAHARVAEMGDFFAFIQERMGELLAEWDARRG